MGLSDTELQNLFGAGFIVAIVVWLVWRRLRMKPLMRRLVSVPVTKLSGVGEGEVVRVVGVIQGHGIRLRAPLTGLRSAWYHTGVYERERVGSLMYGGWIYWNPVLREQRGFDFTIDDSTAIARIHGDSLRVLSPPDLDDRVGWLLEPNERERGYLQQNRVPVRRWFGQRELRLAETVLEPGDRVAVVGRVRSVSHGEEGRVGYEITALPEGFVLLSDERRALA